MKGSMWFEIRTVNWTQTLGVFDRLRKVSLDSRAVTIVHLLAQVKPWAAEVVPRHASPKKGLLLATSFLADNVHASDWTLSSLSGDGGKDAKSFALWANFANASADRC
ncbi:hypothetical protein LIA77_06048 [Sarocladium implicatum]|nr:hypothetical protein LIA77_06048 [Sarocladium implicatum]